MCTCIIVHNCHTQHRTVLIIFRLILQTIIIPQMMSTGGDGAPNSKQILEKSLPPGIGGADLDARMHLTSQSLGYNTDR